MAEREKEIIALIVNGMSSKQIAGRLNLRWGAVGPNIPTYRDFSDTVSGSCKCMRLDFYLSNSIFLSLKKLPDSILQKYTPLETLFAAQFML